MIDTPDKLPVDLSTTASFELGGFDVLPAQKLLRNEQQSIELEPRVMQVLVALCESSPDVCSRETLLTRCWSGTVVGDDAIQRCIGVLRRALRDVKDVRIKTITRIGYQLLLGNQQERRLPRHGRPPESPPVLGVEKFTDRTGHLPDQTFVELLSDDIAAALIVHRELKVVDLARTPTGESDFLLSGAMRRTADGVRLTLQLRETQSGTVIWTHQENLLSPDHPVPDDDLIVSTSGMVANELMRYVTQRVVESDSDTAWANVIRANAAYQRIDLPNLQLAEKFARHALELDADYGAAHAALANALAATYELKGGIFSNNNNLATESHLSCNRALSLDQDNPTVLAWVSNALGMITRPAQGMPVVERALELAPTHHIAHLYLARHCLYQQQPERALEALTEHQRVAPRFPWTYWVTYLRAIAEFMLGNIELADRLIDQAAIMNPEYPYLWIGKMVTAGLLGKQAEAYEAAKKLRSIDGEDSLELQLARVQHSYSNEQDTTAILEALKVAWQAESSNS
jgi:DNA-binding winged helix-turn-helix (wHTH) protein/tetratricopeptide (TPR) repeat protein